MPLMNVFSNSAYYWVLNGLFISYFLFHPDYTPPSWSSSVMNFWVGGFFVSEVMNGLCHLHLRNLRKPGTRERGIPRGFGFNQVSCANYFWEILAWVCFALVSQCLTSYLFLVASGYILLGWSMTRHKNYIKEFDGKEGR